MSLLVLLTSLVSQYYTTLYRQQDEHQAKALRMWDGENSVSWVEMYITIGLMNPWCFQIA